MNNNGPRQRPQLMQAILHVQEKILLTPHYIRIILTGKDVGLFAAAGVGDNNKIIVPLDKHRPIELPEFGRGRGLSAGPNAVVRTYTLRNLDLEKGSMTIDFVSHGDTGPASAWAIHAEPGDSLGVLMKVKDKALFQPADWYFLAGDHTALPVISAILERIPKHARGKALIKVSGPEDILSLEKPEGIELQWIFGSQPADGSPLVEAFQQLELPADRSKFIFIAAEHRATSEIQEMLRRRNDLQRHEWQAYSYWKQGQTEDHSAEERVRTMHY